jgi:hypothetical protein
MTPYLGSITVHCSTEELGRRWRNLIETAPRAEPQPATTPQRKEEEDAHR